MHGGAHCAVMVRWVFDCTSVQFTHRGHRTISDDAHGTARAPLSSLQRVLILFIAERCKCRQRWDHSSASFDGKKSVDKDVQQLTSSFALLFERRALVECRLSPPSTSDALSNTTSRRRTSPALSHLAACFHASGWHFNLK